MATRAQITLLYEDDGFDCKSNKECIFIYKHHDGYPKDVLKTLVPFVKKFHESRGCSDGYYLLCQIVRVFAFRDAIEKMKYSKSNIDDMFETTGWGLDRDKHGDIDYLYEISSKGEIFVNGKLVTDELMKVIFGG